MCRIVITSFLISCAFFAWCQPVANFNTPLQACIQQKIVLQNQSTAADRFEWDLCQGDLSLTPSANNVRNLGGSVTTGIDVVFDGTNWFGFVTSQSTNSILRLDFGADVYSTPSIVDLGNINGKINSPTDIKIITENGNWYGFVYGLADPLLSRIDFGTSLSNTISSPIAISAESIISGAGSVNGGFDMQHDGNNWFIVHTLNASINISRLPAITLPPTPSDKISNVHNPFATALGDLVLQNHNGNYFGYVVDYGGKSLQRLNFGATLFSAPVVDNIPLALLSGFSPYGIDMGLDNNEYYLFISTLEGALLKVSMGADLSVVSATASSLGNLTVLENTLKIVLIKNQSKWIAFSPSWSTMRLFRIDFPSPVCEASFATILTEESPSISFNNPGLKPITLRAFKSTGEFSELSKTVTISSNIAPAIDIGYANVCVSNATQFEAISSAAIQTYNWNFGDAGISIEANPVHQYMASAEYEVNILVTAPNGCQNTSARIVKIYNEPIASFSLPAGLVCTNNEFTFINTTSDDFDGNLVYSWWVNDISESNTRNFIHAFSSSGDQQIKLRTSIPGCFSEVTQTILNVQTGPTVDFSYVGKCEDEVIEFTNESSGLINSFQWDFGNGNISALQNPTEIYPEKGNYNVVLQATAPNGCVSTYVKPISIYSVPQPDFALDLPPFSCAGSSSQFNDLTPALTDSNITSWSWSFGDVASGSSTQKNPNYAYATAADYDVSLQVTSNFGCSGSILKTITISPSPVAEFASGPACINKPTQFTDASGSDAKAWLWSVNNSSYTTQNPTHTFTTTGAQSVMLTVTGNNNCVNQTTKTVNVPVPVVADFTSVSTCAGNTAVFHETSTEGVDPAIAWNWNFAGQANASTSPAQHVFQNTGNFPVTLTSTRQSGCSYSITKSIAISQSPTASFTASTESGAAPLAVGFTNTSSLATSFLWKFNDPNNSTSNEFSPAFVFDQLGSYRVELMASNAAGCSDSFTETIQVVVPDINARLSDFILSSTPDGGKKATVTIENKSNITLVNPEVFIDLAGNALIREKLTGTIPPGQSITRILTVDIIPRELTYACAEVKVLGDSYQFDNRACLNLTTEPTYLQPYPNPAQSQLFIDWINEDQQSLQVVIYNSSGQIAMNRTYNLLRGLNQVLVNVNDLAAGIYFVSYSDDRIIQSFRFSIVR